MEPASHSLARASPPQPSICLAAAKQVRHDHLSVCCIRCTAELKSSRSKPLEVRDMKHRHAGLCKCPPKGLHSHSADAQVQYMQGTGGWWSIL